MTDMNIGKSLFPVSVELNPEKWSSRLAITTIAQFL